MKSIQITHTFQDYEEIEYLQAGWCCLLTG